MKHLKKDSLFKNIAQIIETARNKVRRSVNSTLVLTYWQIGNTIVEDELEGNYRADYGKEILQSLSVKLTEHFGKGFDVTNLRKMKQFYSLFPKQDAVSLELSWTYYRHLLRLDKEVARKWYMQEAAKVKSKDDNPTIGLILCSKKNEVVAKYSILAENKQLFASKYKFYLPSEKQLTKEMTKERNIIESLLDKN
ncbi:MAG: PDDEXK nuclease domain-containing protein [Candidatus Cloacimonetes bacterium]|nr:PDDEXK nuclease domain-containing protein [Candidatus Cloacimonadota bacterium]MCF7815162.1 PDDEXK nuclease domain-containing protein [Candidatus Cloacimonadota bacterium]MCF7869380.1 PDDEXK nuclease domain-containing protein [Candidatus Cloacimonadota bacterium]MCF7884782.1 PDDEXK nuclease domain-containing protein [Candidatus Cloacimonadota bacterium]